MLRSRLSTMSITDLRQEIERRQKLLPKLIAQRDALSREITELQGLAAPEARKAGKKARGRRRPDNKIGLANLLAQVMKGKAKVTIGEAMEGVLSAGYKTTSSHFRQVVNKTLLTDKRFKNVARGVFTLKA